MALAPAVAFYNCTMVANPAHFDAMGIESFDAQNGFQQNQEIRALRALQDHITEQQVTQLDRAHWRANPWNRFFGLNKNMNLYLALAQLPVTDATAAQRAQLQVELVTDFNQLRIVWAGTTISQGDRDAYDDMINP